MSDHLVLMIGRERRYMIRWCDVVRMLPPLPNRQFSRLQVTFQNDPIELSREDVDTIETLVESLSQMWKPSIRIIESYEDNDTLRAIDPEPAYTIAEGAEVPDGFLGN